MTNIIKKSLFVFGSSLLLVLGGVLWFSCTYKLPESPEEGAEYFCEKMKNIRHSGNLSEAEVLAKKCIDKYQNEDIETFMINVSKELYKSENRSVLVFIQNAEPSNRPFLSKITRKIYLINWASSNGISATISPSDEALFFCYAIIDCSRKKNFNRAKKMMNDYVNWYVSYIDNNTIEFRDEYYSDCQEFCEQVAYFIKNSGSDGEEFFYSSFAS